MQNIKMFYFKLLQAVHTLITMSRYEIALSDDHKYSFSRIEWFVPNRRYLYSDYHLLLDLMGSRVLLAGSTPFFI